LRHAVSEILGAGDFAGVESDPTQRVRAIGPSSKSVSLTVVVPIVIVSMIMIVAAIVVTTLMIVLSIVLAAPVVRLIFSGPYEIHRPVAGIILSAMLAPILRMTGGYVQIDGRGRRPLRHDQHRLRMREGRGRGVAELNLAIATGRYLSR